MEYYFFFNIYLIPKLSLILVVYTMSGVADMGMVWMGAGQPSDISLSLMSNDNGEMLLDQDSPYYTPSHHSTSNQSLEDIQAVQSSPMVKDFVKKSFILLLFSIFVANG